MAQQLGEKRVAPDSREDGLVILYYKYVELGDDQAVESAAEQQRETCTALGLSGRMRIAAEGINGTLFGSEAQISKYQEFMEASELFGGIQYKYSKGAASCKKVSDPFEGELSIKVCKEITSTGPMKGSKPTALGGEGGRHLKPAEFHEIVKRAAVDDNIVLIDTRNHYETAVGSFKNAVDPKIRNFAQFPAWLDANREHLHGKHIAMFCTGGIRCEKASAYVRKLGIASEVSQLEGGIHSYLEQFSEQAQRGGIRTKKLCVETPQELTAKAEISAAPVGPGTGEPCLYEGINFQFDNRFSRPEVGEGQNAAVYEPARCQQCAKHFNVTRKNAVCAVCKDFVLICDDCIGDFDATDPVFQPSGSPVLTERSILCFEHQLLSDRWEHYMARLDFQPSELQRHLASLRRLEEACASKRGASKRRRTLALQAGRIEQLLERLNRDAGAKSTKVGEAESGELGAGTDKRLKFAPFVPFFEWRAKPGAAEAQ